MSMEILNRILQMNLIGIYGILLAFAVRLLLRKAGSRYCYALWTVVFLNLVLPTVLTGNFSLIPKQLYQVGFGTWDEEIGYDSDSSITMNGGVLIEPATYELQEGYERYMIAADWQYYAGFFALIGEGSWFWQGDTLEQGNFGENHMESEYVEMLDDTAKTAYLLEVQYDLYTAAGQAALEESGLDLNEIDTVSKYWYIIFVDDGATTGYCLGLAQNLFTKEEAIAIAQPVVFVE